MEEFVWAQKYRPLTVDETILPERIKTVFAKFVEDGNLPNLLLTGSAGVGKTTIAKAVLNEIGADYIVINGSMSGNIDTLRTEIANFASRVSFEGKRKYVILDEADYINANSTQPALRNFMEEFSKNCGFILTANFKNRIIPPLHSRCSVIDFTIAKDEKAQVAKEFFKRICNILRTENVPFDKKVLAEVMRMYMPDWRRVLNELQRYSRTGAIDEGILTNRYSQNMDVIVPMLAEKKFTEMRKWVAENTDIDSASLYKQLFDELPTRLNSAASIAQAIMILAEYQYKEAFVANPEINRVACLAELMTEVKWT